MEWEMEWKVDLFIEMEIIDSNASGELLQLKGKLNLKCNSYACHCEDISYIVSGLCHHPNPSSCVLTRDTHHPSTNKPQSTKVQYHRPAIASTKTKQNKTNPQTINTNAIPSAVVVSSWLSGSNVHPPAESLATVRPRARLVLGRIITSEDRQGVRRHGGGTTTRECSDCQSLFFSHDKTSEFVKEL